MRIVRGLSITVMIVTYAVLVHHVNASGQASTLGAVLALMPVFLLIITVAVKTTSRAAGISLLLISGIASWLAWPFIKQYTGFVFWIQDIGLLLVFFFTFFFTF